MNHAWRHSILPGEYRKKFVISKSLIESVSLSYQTVEEEARRRAPDSSGLAFK